MIRVLLAEDSAKHAALLRELLSGDPSMCLVGEALRSNAAEAARARAADVVLFGIASRAPEHLEGLRPLALGGLPALGVMHPGNGPVSAYCALEAGAFDVIWLGREVSAELARQLARAVRKAAGSRPPPAACARPALQRPSARPRLVVVGSSAGGPSALRALLGHLPSPMPMPIVVAQHIDHGFLDTLVAWLSEVRPCREAESGARPEPNCVYFAPESRDLAFAANGSFQAAPAGSGHFHPCVDRLFESAACSFGAGALAVVLSGMGRDGARGCSAIRGAGGLVLVQAPESAAMPGMPSAALESGPADAVATPEKLGDWLSRFVARPSLRAVG